ncbi:MAG: glycine/sarcosine/betaine reductase component B subunit [Candidatus Binatia bacterium]
MELELARYPVTSLRKGEGREYEDGHLVFDVEMLRHLLLGEPLLAEVEIHVVHPGDRTRILHVVDIVEPRWKPSEIGSPFPGSLGTLSQSGTGRTHVLENIAVVTSATFPGSEEAIIDMCGLGSELSRFGRMWNLVLVPKPRDGVGPGEFGLAVMRSGLRAACFLAEATKDLEPSQTERFRLEVTELLAPGLPRVGYFYYVYSHGIGRQKLFYGRSTKDLLPTVIHPNEPFDGAIVNDGYTKPTKNATHDIQNHALIRELYRRHGRELFFAGVVLANHHATYKDKETTALLGARLLKHALGAEAVVISKDGGGQADVDLMLACKACERLGMRTVLLAKEESGVEGAALVDMAPEADAIVSVGNCPEVVLLSQKMDLIIGGPKFLGAIQGDVAGMVELPITNIIGAIDSLGGSRLAARLG